MHIRTRVTAGALAAVAVAGCAAGTAAAQTAPRAPGQLTFTSQLLAIQFFTASGPITGFPARLIWCGQLAPADPGVARMRPMPAVHAASPAVLCRGPGGSSRNSPVVSPSGTVKPAGTNS